MDIPAIVRDEKNNQRLSELQENFYTVARLEIAALERSMIKASDRDLVILEQDILSAKRSIKNLQDLRIKKVIKAAVSDAYRKAPEHVLDPMLPAERNLYNCIIQGISDIRS